MYYHLGDMKAIGLSITSLVINLLLKNKGNKMIVMVISQSHSDPSSYNIVDLDAWFPTDKVSAAVKADIERELFSPRKEYYEEGYRTSNAIYNSGAELHLPVTIDHVVSCFCD